MPPPHCTHWCYNCNRPVCPHGGDSICPCCNAGFLQDLHHYFAAHSRDPWIQRNAPSDGGGFSPMDSLAAIFGPVMPDREPNFDTQPHMGLEPHPAGGTDFYDPHLVGEPILDPSQYFANGEQIPVGYGDFDLYEMMEHISRNDRVGAGSQPASTQPAPRSAINALPTIKITQRHLNTDANCSVCLDEFVLGSEAKKMPCNHIFHLNCIVTWLSAHNSCPICRHELTSDGSRRERRQNPFSYLWPSTSRH